MRIIQHTPCLTQNDAISNDILEIDKIIKSLQIKTHIYADIIENSLKKIAKKSLFLKLKSDDILILHVSTYSDFYNGLENIKCKKVFFYHNITPPEYLIEMSADIYENSVRGIEQAQKLLTYVDYVCADSKFNAADINKMGWNKPITVIPIIYNFKSRSNISEDIELKKELQKQTNILFVGRLVPNKKQTDILSAFIIYNKFFNPNSVLHLIGSHLDNDIYIEKIKQLINFAGLQKKVSMPGKVSENKLLTYYKNSQLFLSMSEHEGFSVPMVESMFYNLPVLAYFDSGALPETLGKGGIYFTEKKIKEIAFIMDEIIRNKNLQNTIKQNLTSQSNLYKYDFVRPILINFIKEIIS